MNSNGFLHRVQRKFRLLSTKTQKQKQKVVNEKLPSEDVLSEILIRLPAKQIARMRCVCKRWNHLLSEPYFIKSHLHRNLIRNKNKDNEILLVLTSSKEDDGLMVTAHPSRSPYIKLDDLIRLPVNFPRTPNVRWRVIGSVNGLICFQCGSNNSISALYIWNPSLSAVMRLPDFTRPSASSYKCYGFCFRFGFDPKSDDYKVIKIVRCPDLEVEVYSMRKGTWGLISHETFPDNVYPLFSHPNKVDGHMHNGRLYWLCWKPSDDCQTVVAFDLGDQKFFEISLPGGTEIKSKRHFQGLYSFNGKLCVSTYNRYDKVHEIWVMNEYGVTESWVKHHVLSQLNWYIQPVGFTLNNELYFKESFHGPLALCDLKDITKVKYFDNCHVNEETQIVQYIDSLVWITPTKKHGKERHKRDGKCSVFSCWLKLDSED